MNQNQKNAVKKCIVSRNNTESVSEAWASLAAHMSLLYISCPQQTNPISAGAPAAAFHFPPSLHLPACTPSFIPAWEQCGGIKFALEVPTEEELELVAGIIKAVSA